MKTILKMAVVVTSVIFVAQAEAQISALKSTGAAYGNAVTDAVAPADVSQEAIVQSFIQANIAVLQAQERFADAFGNKEASAKARAAVDSLQGGSTEMDKKSLKASFEITDEVVAQSQEWLDAGTELSAEGRDSYIEGLALETITPYEPFPVM